MRSFHRLAIGLALVSACAFACSLQPQTNLIGDDRGTGSGDGDGAVVIDQDACASCFGGDTDATTATTDQDATMGGDSSTPGMDAAAKDAAVKDAGHDATVPRDAGHDAAPDAAGAHDAALDAPADG